jgi:hypothetical protein
MIQIGDKLISLDILEQKFTCNLEECQGGCCVHGDSGAPLSEMETSMLDKEFENIINYLSLKGIDSIRKQGKWLFDADGDRVTPLIEGCECAYTVFEKGIARCGIENACKDGKTTFRKPISCHLYPLRVSRVGNYYALNYHQWSVCQPARILGTKLDIPVFKFLKEGIIRAWGDAFYYELEKTAAILKNDHPLKDL